MQRRSQAEQCSAAMQSRRAAAERTLAAAAFTTTLTPEKVLMAIIFEEWVLLLGVPRLRPSDTVIRTTRQKDIPSG